ncbi:hypothetical protein EVAR_49655_1 [Eumeta japonica]|uniref:Uncharacterized protein n=1 Tax=Eumeta variegata TaxID=151549 RepID=A0A4C1YAN2_EUMVA|nr:hypothetical protein EVAR_49655_1 [Eumeta japonica]
MVNKTALSPGSGGIPEAIPPSDPLKVSRHPRGKSAEITAVVKKRPSFGNKPAEITAKKIDEIAENYRRFRNNDIHHKSMHRHKLIPMDSFTGGKRRLVAAADRLTVQRQKEAWPPHGEHLRLTDFINVEKCPAPADRTAILSPVRLCLGRT